MSALNSDDKNKPKVNAANNQTDETDKPPISYNVTNCSLFSSGFSILFHLVDVSYDYYIAHTYFTTDMCDYFYWTLALILIPSVIITLISVTMYINDRKESDDKKYYDIRTGLCLVGICVQLAPVIRHFDALNYGRKSLKAKSNFDIEDQKKYYIKMVNEDSDVALLRVFECYLESAPQQVLQIVLLLIGYIEGSNTFTIIQIVGIMFGFVTMAWCMANYNRSIRVDQNDKQNLSTAGIIVLFFSHLSLTVSRILALSAVALLFAFWTCIAILCHWFLMTVWLVFTTKTTFCCKKIFEIFFTASVGLVYIFNFLNVREGSTKKAYIIYFSICFMENVAIAAVWGVFFRSYIKDQSYYWCYYFFLIFPIVCFVLGVLLLVEYYRSFHPNKLKSNFNRNELNSGVSGNEVKPNSGVGGNEGKVDSGVGNEGKPNSGVSANEDKLNSGVGGNEEKLNSAFGANEKKPLIKNVQNNDRGQNLIGEQSSLV